MKFMLNLFIFLTLSSSLFAEEINKQEPESVYKTEIQKLINEYIITSMLMYNGSFKRCNSASSLQDYINDIKNLNLSNQETIILIKHKKWLLDTIEQCKIIHSAIPLDCSYLSMNGMKRLIKSFLFPISPEDQKTMAKCSSLENELGEAIDSILLCGLQMKRELKLEVPNFKIID